jgi:hypothetical protein
MRLTLLLWIQPWVLQGLAYLLFLGHLYLVLTQDHLCSRVSRQFSFPLVAMCFFAASAHPSLFVFTGVIIYICHVSLFGWTGLLVHPRLLLNTTLKLLLDLVELPLKSILKTLDTLVDCHQLLELIKVEYMHALMRNFSSTNNFIRFLVFQHARRITKNDVIVI